MGAEAPAPTPGWRIERDDPSRPPVQALLREHLAHMHRITPPEQVFALDVDGLRAPDIAFWTAWDGDGALLGCAALKALSPAQGEIKSMRTPAARRRRGAGRALLEHVLAEARRRGYARVSLETGAHPDFAPAHALYRSAGFVACGPFAGYAESPYSRFMTLALEATGAH